MTPDQIADRARAMATGVLAFDLADWSGWTDVEQRAACALTLQLFEEWRSGGPRRLAMKLFRSWLTPAERAELRSRRQVTVRGSAGGTYRIFPATGTTWRTERHGSRWYGRSRFCLHPDAHVPPGDIALAHYLLIQTDEPAFLAQANEHKGMLWNGEWLRRLNAARRACEEAA